MKPDNIDPLAIANTPEISRDNTIDSFREFTTTTESFKAIYAALHMTAQLMQADASKTITMTPEDRAALYDSYYQLMGYLEEAPEGLEEDELEEGEIEEDEFEEDEFEEDELEEDELEEDELEEESD